MPRLTRSRLAVVAAALLATFLVPRLGGPGPVRAANSLSLVGTWYTPGFANFYTKDITGELFSSPAVGDVDGDGKPDVVVGFPDGMVYGFHTDGTRFLSFNTGAGAVQSSPTLVDLNGDGVLDILVANTAGRVVGFNGAGQVLFDAHDSCHPRCGVFGTPTVADLNRDGRLAVIVGSWDEHIYAWHLDGSLVPGFPFMVYDTEWSSPSVADIDGDGYPEIVIGGDSAGVAGQPYPTGGLVWVIRHDGTNEPGWPHFFPGQVIWSSPAIGDINGDGNPDIVVGTGNDLPRSAGKVVNAFDSAGNYLPGWPVTVGGLTTSSPALGDITGDGHLDVVTMADDGAIYAFDGAGHLLPGWPKCQADVPATECPVPLHSSVTLADVFNTGKQNVVAGGEQWLRVYNGDGSIAAAEPTRSGMAPLTSAPTVANVNGQAWIVASGGFDSNGDGVPDQGAIWVWTTGAPAGLSAWPTFRHGSLHSGHAFLGTAGRSGRYVARLAGGDRYDTAAVISKATYAAGVPVVYIATGEKFADALAGTPAAVTQGGPMLLVKHDSIPTPTATELTRLKPGKIVVLGGTDAVADGVVTQLGGYTSGGVTRIAGGDRYETAADVSQATFSPLVPVVYVATGVEFPDALAAGAAAGAKKGPVLLVPGTSIPMSVQVELTRLHPQSIVVAGGPNAVSPDVEQQLHSYTTGSVKRDQGADRSGTAVAIAADAFGTSVPGVFVSTGLNFPDALAGGVAAAKAGAPLLTVPGDTVPNVTRGEINTVHPAFALILGGPTAVGDLVQDELNY